MDLEYLKSVADLKSENGWWVVRHDGCISTSRDKDRAYTALCNVLNHDPDGKAREGQRNFYAAAMRVPASDLESTK